MSNGSTYAIYSGDATSAGSISPDVTDAPISGQGSMSMSLSAAAVMQGIPSAINLHVSTSCGPLTTPITVTDFNEPTPLFSGYPNANGNLSFSTATLSQGLHNLSAYQASLGFHAGPLSFAVSTAAALPPSVSVFAGLNAVYACSGDGGPASAAGFANLTSVAVDSQGNIYLGDNLCRSIRKIDTSGNISTVVSGIPRNRTGDVVYFSQLYSYQVSKVVNGQVVAVAGSNSSSGAYQGDGIAATQANIYPYQITFAADGTLYISDEGNRRIFAVSSGIIHTVAGGGTVSPAEGVAALQASQVWGPIAVDSHKTVYVSVGATLYSIGANGILHVVPGLGDYYAYSLAVDQQDNLYMQFPGSYNIINSQILKLSGGQITQIAGNSIGSTFSSVNALLALLPPNVPEISVDSKGNIYTVGVEFGESIAQVIRPYANNLNTPLRFVPVTRCRIADTRLNTSTYGSQLPAQTSRDFPVSASSCNIPTTAQAYSVNLTAVPPAAVSYVSLWPTNFPQPNVSILNSDGRIKANAAILRAGDNNSLSVFTTDPTDIVLDINGYFVPASTSTTALQFYPLTPCRIADTRNPVGPLGGPIFKAGQTRTFPVQSSSCHVPATAQAYSLNFTVVAPGGLAYLSTWPAGSAQPVVSTLNSNGTIVANAAIVPAGTNGGISVYATDSTHVVVDINGYFAPPTSSGLSLYAAAPCRALDTRNLPGGAPFNGTIVSNIAGSGCGAPTTAQAFVLNATIVPPSGFSYLSLWPDGQSQPYVSTLNALDGEITSNMAIVPSTNGSIDAFGTDPVYLILDLAGYFAP